MCSFMIFSCVLQWRPAALYVLSANSMEVKTPPEECRAGGLHHASKHPLGIVSLTTLPNQFACENSVVGRIARLICT
jgi:hypothetical protein